MKKTIVFVLIISTILIQVGCNQNQSGKVEESENTGKENLKDSKNNDKQIMNRFNSLIKENKDLMEIIEFIDGNIKTVSKENASKIIDEFEKLQEKSLIKIEEKFYDEDIQKKINDIYEDGFDIEKIKLISDEKLKKLLLDTIYSGYKIETAEGMYFPIINYEFYKNYSWNVTDDMRDYIDIMSVESEEPPAKDAALIIDWKEVIERALNQEKFIANYENSEKIYNIKNLYKNYVTFIFYGLNNTPLFSYDTKIIDESAKGVYIDYAEKNSKSKLLHKLSSFLEMLKQSDYKLTKEIEEYRENIAKELIGIGE